MVNDMTTTDRETVLRTRAESLAKRRKAVVKEEDKLPVSVITVGLLLMLVGYVSGGWLMGASALKASALLASGGGDDSFLRAKLVTARFYCEHYLPRADACLGAVTAGSDSIMALTAEQF